MPLGDLLEKAGKLKEKAEQVQIGAFGAVTQVLDEFQEAIPAISALGLCLKEMKLGLGVTPEMGGKFIGPIEAVNANKIRELSASNQEKKVLVSILKALETASQMKERFSELGFHQVELEFKLEIPPKITVRFLAPAA